MDGDLGALGDREKKFREVFAEELHSISVVKGRWKSFVNRYGFIYRLIWPELMKLKCIFICTWRNKYFILQSASKMFNNDLMNAFQISSYNISLEESGSHCMDYKCNCSSSIFGVFRNISLRKINGYTITSQICNDNLFYLNLLIRTWGQTEFSNFVDAN